MSKQSVEFSKSLSAADAAVYLETLARGLRGGLISVEVGKDFVDLSIGAEVSLELEARTSDKGRSSIEFSLEWRAPRQLDDSGPQLVIHTDGPVNREPASEDEDEDSGSETSLEPVLTEE